MHVRLGAFDVVVKVVAEELDAEDGLLSDFGRGKVTWKQDWKMGEKEVDQKLRTPRAV